MSLKESRLPGSDVTPCSRHWDSALIKQDAVGVSLWWCTADRYSLLLLL